MKGAKKKTAPATAAKGGLDVDAVRELAEIVATHGLSELKFENADVVLVLRRQTAPPAAPASAGTHAPAHAAPAPAPARAVAPLPEPKPENGQYFTVSSPFVGTFYRSPGPEAPPFVEIGQRVKKGQVLCIVEAMKLMNEIECEVDGIVAAILADNAAPVEYGQALFKISP